MLLDGGTAVPDLAPFRCVVLRKLAHILLHITLFLFLFFADSFQPFTANKPPAKTKSVTMQDRPSPLTVEPPAKIESNKKMNGPVPRAVGPLSRAFELSSVRESFVYLDFESPSADLDAKVGQLFRMPQKKFRFVLIACVFCVCCQSVDSSAALSAQSPPMATADCRSNLEGPCPWNTDDVSYRPTR
jgi:hypothetical protein